MTDRMEDLARWVRSSFGELESVAPIAGDASHREFYRITSGGVTFIVMDSSRTPLWPWLDIHNLLRGMDFPVPGVVLSDESRGYVIQEDLGDTRLCDVKSKKEYTAYLQQALSLLRRFHREITPAKASGSIAGRRYFTTSFFMAELEHTLEHLFFRLLRVPVEELMETQKLMRILCEKAMGSTGSVFTHRDFHSANLMISGDRVCMVDWQDARQGPPCYDLASLLRDSYHDCGEQWRNMAQAFILGINGANLFEFVFSALQRNLKALGTFAYQYRACGNDRYLKYMPLTLRYMEEYPAVCPAVGKIVENILGIIDRHTGEIDLRNFRESDSPVKINL